MRLALGTALFVAAIGASSAALAEPKDLGGTWLTEDGRAKIRMDRCGGTNFCGKVVWLKIPTWDDGTPRTDAKNPDPKKRARAMMGLQLTTVRPAEDKYSGNIYNADNGKIYEVSMERESAAELTVTGCMLGVLCGSQTWKKVADINLAAVAPAAAKPAAPKPAARPAAAAAPAAAPAQAAAEE